MCMRSRSVSPWAIPRPSGTAWRPASIHLRSSGFWRMRKGARSRPTHAKLHGFQTPNDQPVRTEGIHLKCTCNDHLKVCSVWYVLAFSFLLMTTRWGPETSWMIPAIPAMGVLWSKRNYYVQKQFAGFAFFVNKRVVPWPYPQGLQAHGLCLGLPVM